jgi:hypothetical protein
LRALAVQALAQWAVDIWLRAVMVPEGLAEEGGKALAKWRSSSLSSSSSAAAGAAGWAGAAAAEQETQSVKRGGRAVLFRLKGLGKGAAGAMMMVVVMVMIVLVFLRV